MDGNIFTCELLGAVISIFKELSRLRNLWKKPMANGKFENLQDSEITASLGLQTNIAAFDLLPTKEKVTLEASAFETRMYMMLFLTIWLNLEFSVNHIPAYPSPSAHDAKIPTCNDIYRFVRRTTIDHLGRRFDHLGSSFDLGFSTVLFPYLVRF